jgi:geranylgeranyl diphosphate synthase type I
VWNVWGVNQAINAGDGIYGLAFQILADSLDSLAQVSAETLLEITAGLGKACVDTVQGQMLDISFEKRMIVGVDEYAQMTALKTGPLIGLALGGGALLAGSPREIGTKLNAIGRALGIAFQIQDDILGIWGDTTKTGKSSFDDLMQKKKSLPVLWALENLPEPDNAHLHALYQKPAPLDMETMRDILTMFEAHQVRRVIEARRDHYYQQVVDGLQRLYPSSDYQREIRAIVDFIVQRQY